MFIIFDLDGTLANIEHRLHFITKDVAPINGKSKRKPDWDSFHKACIHDQPIQPIIEIFQALKSDQHHIEIWSGRSDAVRNETVNWLDNNHLYPNKLLMRMDGDYTPDHELKQMWLNQAAEAGMVPDLVFDDRSRLVEMWRRNGIRCCQVAPGEF
jgi:hypothetical protein